MKKTIDILGVPFLHTTRQAFIETLQRHVEQKSKTFVVTANPEIVMHSLQDEQYRGILQQADYITADGIGVVKAASIIGDPLPERVSGYDIMLDLLQVADRQRYSVYFLGAAEEVLQATVAKVREEYPNVKIAGHQNGFFDRQDPGVAEAIKESGADLVFVALGFPRQEQWIGKYLPLFDKGVFIGVGGSFDVFSGNVNRAPDVWIKLNLEWFYRLAKQPSRWKRMLVLPKFALVILRGKASRKK
ncbi:WecB/TagA/CpsF family glycosyltransferase [Planococcus lenghuensis]|uniref:N-acetylglucosaminyldiphosphoundecaprenol N-acetyl-beta-D-mannosaminyltransferase n=1 Tax=Planococcus lenghuensis TaxID=2213202 RepID=A0A1Q2L1G3_9BACL|nr:WecB/TagA/CpsF family glycosyltransferase [Planococcus lenghuensis]AQQ54246.1 glycosyltransferase [Planococcus lenghuensis]